MTDPDLPHYMTLRLDESCPKCGETMLVVATRCAAVGNWPSTLAKVKSVQCACGVFTDHLPDSGKMVCSNTLSRRKT